jgi:hypothetical protein
MNNKGQAGGILIAVLIGIMIFMSGMLFINYIKDDVTTARSSSNMDCSNLNISDGAKVTCLGIDLLIPYFIVSVLSASGAVITARFLI